MQTAVQFINDELLGAQQELSRLHQRVSRSAKQSLPCKRPIRHDAPWERDEQRELDDRCSYLKALRMAVQDSLHLFQGSPDGIQLATLVVMSLAAPDTIGRSPSDMLPLLANVPWEQLLSECRSWQEEMFSQFSTEAVQSYVSRSISGLLQRHSSPRLQGKLCFAERETRPRLRPRVAARSSRR